MRTAEQIRYLVLAAQREGNRQLMAALSPLGLTPAQSEALRILADHGPLALKALGEMLVCDSGSSPSRIIDRLVAAGLVRKDADVSDRRAVSLSLTPEGAESADAVRAIEDAMYEQIDAAVDAGDGETLVRTLRALTHGTPAGTAFDARLAAPPAR
ncbi:MarR family winged helix-turn-helix transcriptional regulator [Leifsonia shinshuensis]|uniref:DNA-binding MarR family transcriptional regulator n=1 Tax=Leifsonia shinshuensis TaxID=150026 RepID=A0A853CW88_9MICO|nr:MarR family transcriptional regulator [Leifsonia shinshuensis]NYJ23080.1 DNA-binding MarR family transcriptional regulator [Leifsonia shinshuensis]